MNVYHGLHDYVKTLPVALTIGSFDGVHHGHQEIIHSLKADAARLGCLSAIMTFTPHPRIVLNKDRENLRLLNSDLEKQELLDRFGIDILFFMPFDQAFLSQSANTFLHDMLLRKIGTKHIVLGYDHRFGNNREGDIHFLQAQAAVCDYTVDEISRQHIDDIAVSSTKIRQALEVGDIGLANKMLGYSYEMTGMVIKGDQIGRTLGYPTANLQANDSYKQMPAFGVYACEAWVNESWLPAMCYIGNRPTISGQKMNIEVNILDWHGDLYDANLRIRFLSQVRGDIKFSDLTALKNQIASDEKVIRDLFK